jgi:hypothetical protein
MISRLAHVARRSRRAKWRSDGLGRLSSPSSRPPIRSCPKTLLASWQPEKRRNPRVTNPFFASLPNRRAIHNGSTERLLHMAARLEASFTRRGGRGNPGDRRTAASAMTVRPPSQPTVHAITAVKAYRISCWFERSRLDRIRGARLLRYVATPRNAKGR